MKRLIIVACLIAVAGVVLFARRRGLSSPDATLLVLGITNLPTGSFARFCLTNNSPKHIACVPVAFEESSAGAWRRTSLTGMASSALRDWIGIREELSPGKAFTFLVPQPITNGPWRVVFLCQEQAPIIDPVTDTVRHLADTNAMNSGLRQFSGRRYYITSPEVAE